MDPTSTRQSTEAPPGNVVVVGAGLAGLRTVERLRRGGHQGSITLIGDEDAHPYDRPPLSKSLLTDDAEPTAPSLRQPDKYDELALDLRTRVSATGLDRGGREVRLDDGSSVGYDALVIATGARARTVASWQQVPHTQVLRTFADAVALRRELRQATSVAVVGAGVLGCEVASSARALGVEVALIDTLDRPMARVVPPQVGAALSDLQVEHGVRLHFAVTVDSLHQADGKPALTLSDDTTLTPDLVVLTIGSTPNTEWLESSGLELADGVVCDSQGRTSDPLVWAVGDVARQPAVPGTDTSVRLEHWTAAGDSASRVAAHLLGKEPLAPTDVPYFWSDQFGIKVQTLGHASAYDGFRVVSGSLEERAFLALLSRGGVVTGAVGMGMPAALMRCRQAVEQGEAVPSLVERSPWERKKVTT